MGLDPTRRAQLNQAKLTALAKSAGANGLTPLGFPGGAAASGDGTLWVFGESAGVATLGGALSVALKSAAYDRLVVIVDDAGDAGVIARRAEYFASPSHIEAAFVDNATDRDFVTLARAPRAPVSQSHGRSPGGSVPEGVDVVVEHGVTIFEVKGLEIGRIEGGELAVGVGKHDREAHRMAHSNATLADIAARVHEGRRADAPPSAMTDLARERWLRWILCSRPGIVGLTELTPVAPPTRRGDLRAYSVAPAVGDGVVVVCSVGVDPDVVPSAADARAMHAPDAELVLVLPEADALPNTRRLAAALKEPARVITVRSDWPSLGD